MAQKTLIEWTDYTWNPATGCSPVSDGCLNCYARKMALRLQARGIKKYADGFELRVHTESLNEPLKIKKPGRIFVCSMSDLFQKAMSSIFQEWVFRVMHKAGRHNFQVLTKSPENMLVAFYIKRIAPFWPENVWAGATIESDKYLDRLDSLRQVPAAVRFVSFEPLLGPISDIDLSGIHWAIAGGETGPGARHMDPAWAESIRKQCEAQNVPFFFKQMGGKNKGGNLLNGQLYRAMPNGDR
jgi:protein gp37